MVGDEEGLADGLGEGVCGEDDGVGGCGDGEEGPDEGGVGGGDGGEGARAGAGGVVDEAAVAVGEETEGAVLGLVVPVELGEADGEGAEDEEEDEAELGDVDEHAAEADL